METIEWIVRNLVELNKCSANGDQDGMKVILDEMGDKFMTLDDPDKLSVFYLLLGSVGRAYSKNFLDENLE